MGRSWIIFEDYRWNDEREEIEFEKEEDIGLTYQTTANLCSIFGHYGVYFPTVDTFKKEEVKKLKEELVEPEKVVEKANEAISLLEREENPTIDDFEEKEKLFDEYDLKIKDAQRLNANLRYYLEKIKEYSKQGKYIAIDFE